MFGSIRTWLDGLVNAKEEETAGETPPDEAAADPGPSDAASAPARPSTGRSSTSSRRDKKPSRTYSARGHSKRNEIPNNLFLHERIHVYQQETMTEKLAKAMDKFDALEPLESDAKESKVPETR